MTLVTFATHKGTVAIATLNFEATSAWKGTAKTATPAALAATFARVVDFVCECALTLWTILCFAKERVNASYAFEVGVSAGIVPMMNNADVVLRWRPFVAGLVATELIKGNNSIFSRVSLLYASCM